jgi:hypothetical protein
MGNGSPHGLGSGAGGRAYGSDQSIFSRAFGYAATMSRILGSRYATVVAMLARCP